MWLWGENSRTLMEKIVCSYISCAFIFHYLNFLSSVCSECSACVVKLNSVRVDFFFQHRQLVSLIGKMLDCFKNNFFKMVSPSVHIYG